MSLSPEEFVLAWELSNDVIEVKNRLRAVGHTNLDVTDCVKVADALRLFGTNLKYIRPPIWLSKN